MNIIIGIVVETKYISRKWTINQETKISLNSDELIMKLGPKVHFNELYSYLVSTIPIIFIVARTIPIVYIVYQN